MTAAESVDTRFRLGDDAAVELAAKFGTPLYVVDEAHFRARIRETLGALRDVWPDSSISFASKANSTLALLAIAASEGCTIDAASEGELRAAMQAGVPASRCHLHGNNKGRGEILFALESGIGMVMADHLSELATLAELGSRAPIALRLAPGVDPVTHAKISTGQADTKFGFNIADGSAEAALLRALDLNLDVVGFHCHVGSQLLDPTAQISGGELIAEFAKTMKAKHGFAASYLNFGGGLGIRYTSADQPIPVREYASAVGGAISRALDGSGLSPHLEQEPGRSLVGESGVTLYRVGVRKTVPRAFQGTRTYLSVDGGLSDNPRPALYGARYEVLNVGRTGPTAEFTVSGKHCETDKLFEDVQLSADTCEGDLLQVLSTGAYGSSMASNYNRYPRAATVLLRPGGEAALVQRRDSWAEMFSREYVPEGLL